MAGNANSGRKRNQYVSDALLVEIKARALDEAGNKRGLRKMAVTIMDAAEAGERWAAEFVRDTVDGKPIQQVNLGDDDNPMTIVARIELVAPQPK